MFNTTRLCHILEKNGNTDFTRSSRLPPDARLPSARLAVTQESVHAKAQRAANSGGLLYFKPGARTDSYATRA